MELMQSVYNDSGLKQAVETNVEGQGEVKVVKEIMQNVAVQQDKLDKEVRKYCAERGA